MSTVYIIQTYRIIHKREKIQLPCQTHTNTLLTNFFFNGGYIDYLSLTYTTNKSIILKVTL